MAAVLGVSVWFALVTVVPGLVTLAVAWGAIVIVPRPVPEVLTSVGVADTTLAVAVAVTVMLVTQAFGILLEEKVLVPRKWLGHGPWTRTLKPGIDPLHETDFAIDPYEEYDGLYLLLAELRADDDTRGHLERAVAQFFLTVNTIISFSLGIVTTVVLVVTEQSAAAMARGGIYAACLAVIAAVSWQVAVSRFELMGWSLSATRRRRVRAARTAMAGEAGGA